MVCVCHARRQLLPSKYLHIILLLPDSNREPHAMRRSHTLLVGQEVLYDGAHQLVPGGDREGQVGQVVDERCLA